MFQIENHVVSIDVGDKVSGMALISFTEDSGGQNRYRYGLRGFILDNSDVVGKITDIMLNSKCHVVIEDMKPYSGKLSPQVIDTCKFIGELCYRLKAELNVNFSLISRSEVRKWVFNAHSDLCIDRIDKKIAYLDDYGERKGKKRYRNKDGTLRKASFHYVDDRVVVAAMKKHWEIPTPKPGKPNVYGFNSHSWQALALGTCYLAKIS